MTRVLFVDDDPLTLATMAKAMQLFGHQALQANSGQEALDLLQNESPGVIFVDNSLPDMSGLELINRISQQEITCHIPVLMLSASPEIDMEDHARAAGARAYLAKPVRLQQLLDVIKQYTQ